MNSQKKETSKIRYINSSRLKNAIIEASRLLNEKKAFVNKINVFPIPDKDTGTNMAHTMNQVCSDISRSSERSIGALSSTVAESALMEAQGCSGVILAHFFSGFADSITDKFRLTTAAFAKAVQQAKKKAYLAFSNPTEGTILTVISDWANHIENAAPKTEDFVEILKTGFERAKISLSETPKKLDILKKAGVVDAGAQGFIYMLEGIENFITKGKITAGDFAKSSKVKKTEERQLPTLSVADVKKVGIVTDSSCDLPEVFIKENPIHIIPLKLIFGDKTYLDKVDITPTEFYNKLVTSDVHPKTSQPAVADIKNVFENVLPLYENIISIHVAGALSGTLRNIEMTAKILTEKTKKIVCVDGKNISGGLGLIVREIVTLIDKKIPFEKIIEQTKQFVADAFALYYQARNNVTLYGDVLPVLSQLHRTFRLVSITNGNADIYQTPTDLAKVMEFSWSAAQAGVEKPHPKIFYDIIKKAGIAKDEMIHVGDDPVSDIFGAHIAGIRSIWINREQQPWPKYIKPAHFTICSLNEMNHLDMCSYREWLVCHKFGFIQSNQWLEFL